MVHTDSDTENGHDKARWVHLWSVHGYTVKLTLDVSRRLKVDHFGHWNIFSDNLLVSIVRNIIILQNFS